MFKKALFIPNDIGGGVGHVRRSSLIARALLQFGWEVGFVVHRKRSIDFIPEDSPTYHVSLFRDKLNGILRSWCCPIHPRSVEPLPGEVLFWEFNSLDYMALRDGYWTPSIVEHRFKKLCSIIKKFKPDLLIGDAHLLTYFLGKYFNIPVVQIIRSFVFPEHPRVIWWKSPPKFHPPNLEPIFLPFLKKYRLPDVTSATKMLTGDAYLVPAFPEFEPIQTSKPILYFGYYCDQEQFNSTNQGRIQHPALLFSIGGGANRNGLKKLYQILLNFLEDKPLAAFVADPFQLIGKSWKNRNVIVEKWFETEKIMPMVDIIIHHGGYTTTMESLFFKKPSIAIPFHSEQEGNARKLEQWEVGRFLNISDDSPVPLFFKYRYGIYSIGAKFNWKLSINDLGNLVDQILNDEKIGEQAKTLGRRVHQYYSSEKINDFLLNAL